MLTHPSKTYRLLAVDDDPDVLELYQTILAPSATTFHSPLPGGDNLGDEGESLSSYFDEEIRFSFEQASQGEEAIERIQQGINLASPFAIAFIDIRMPPGIDGIHTATRIREIDPNIQIFIITAFSDYSVEQIQRQLSHHVVVLNKPFFPADLLQFSANAIRTWERTQEIDQLKRKLSQTLPMEHALSWEANLLNDRFTPSREFERALTQLKISSIPSFSAFLYRIHPDEQGVIRTLIQGGDEFFTLLHRFADGKQNYQWMLTQGRITLWQRGQAVEMYGFSTPITATNKLQSTIDPQTELLTLQRLSHANRVAGISGITELQKQCLNLRNSGQHFTLLIIHVYGTRSAAQRAGKSAGEQLIADCISRLRPTLKADHQLYLYSEDQLAVIQQGNASVERLNAQKED